MGLNPLQLFGGLLVSALGFATGNVGVGLAGAAYAVGSLGLGMAERHSRLDSNTVDPQRRPPIIYGEVRIGATCPGFWVLPQPKSKNLRLALMVTPWCLGSRDGGPIEGIREVWFNGELGIDAKTEPRGVLQPEFVGETTFDNTGLVIDIVPPFDDFDDPDISSWNLLVHLGEAQQGVDSFLRQELPNEFGPNAYGRHVAYSWFVLQRNDIGKFSDGRKPTVAAVIRGRRIYDPRADAWTWSQNPALCLRDLLLDPIGGEGEPASAIHEPSFEEVADYWDVTQLYPIAGGGVVLPRGQLNIALDPAEGARENIRTILDSFGMDLWKQDGQWRLGVRQQKAPIDPAVFQISEDNVVALRGDGPGKFKWAAIGQKTGANLVKANYVDPDRNWTVQTVEWPFTGPQKPNPYLIEDNGKPSVREINLDGVTDPFTAWTLAKRALLEARAGDPFTVVVDSSGLVLEKNDLVWVDHRAMGSDRPLRCWVMDLQVMENFRVAVRLMRYDPAAYEPLLGQTPNQPNVYPVPSPTPQPVAPRTPPTGGGAGSTPPSPPYTPIQVDVPVGSVGSFTPQLTVRVSFQQDEWGLAPQRYEFFWREVGSQKWRPLGTAAHIGGSVDDRGNVLTYEFAAPGAASGQIEVAGRTVYRDGGASDWNFGTGTASRTPPNANVGTVTFDTTNGVVTAVVPTAGTNGTIFHAYVGAPGFTPGPSNRVDGPRIVAPGEDVVFSFVPPGIAAGGQFCLVVGVSDALTSTLGESEALSSPQCATYPGFDVTTDVAFTSCQNLLQFAGSGQRCVPEP